MFIRAFAAASFLATSMAAASAGTVLQPTGKWIVHFDDAQCLAERNYGATEHSLFIALKQPALGDVVQLNVVESGTAGSPIQMNGRISFDDDQQNVLKTTVLLYTPPELKFRVHMMNVPREKLMAAGKSKSLHIRASGLDETFALDSLNQLLKVLDQCATDLRDFWNVKTAPDDQSNVRDDVKGHLSGLISGEDYPPQSFLNGDTGSVKAVLLVNEEGRVADCSVIDTSGAAMLDAQTCAVLKRRARFTAAVDKDGKPAKDAFIQKITWRLF